MQQVKVYWTGNKRTVFAVKQKIGTQAAEPEQRRPDVGTSVHCHEGGDKKKGKLTDVNSTQK